MKNVDRFDILVIIFVVLLVTAKIYVIKVNHDPCKFRMNQQCQDRK